MLALVTRLQRELPKPLLFGLYGAVGALLGAIFLGEMLWAVLKPPPSRAVVPASPPAAVRLTASEKLTVNRGETNTFTVRIVRDYFEGPVVLKCLELPDHITAKDVRLAPDQTDAVVKIAADSDAQVGALTFMVSAEATDPSGKLAASVPVKLAIVKPVRVTASESLGINQGDKNQFTVRIDRDYFDGPVVIKCIDLATGITAKAVSVASGEDTAEVELLAATTAPPGARSFRVVAESERMAGKLSTSTPIQLTVVHVDPPPPPPPVDIVFLLDITGSMQFAIDGVTTGIADFAQDLANKRMDARIGLLAFRDLSYGEDSQQLQFSNSPFTTDYDAFRRSVDRLRANGGGADEESSLDAVEEATRLPFRRESTKVLVLITDAPPRVPDQTIMSIDELVTGMKQHGINQLHLVVPRREFDTYSPLQKAAPGEFFDLQKAANGSVGFAPILPLISATIAKITAQNRPPPPPPPTAQPVAASPAAPAAKTAAPPPAAPEATPVIKAVQSGQEFSADSSLRLLFAIAIWTSIPACGVCLALMGGQSYYLKQTGLTNDQLLQGSLGGLAAGLIGGLAGQLLFQASGSLVHMDAVFRILGWSLLGSLVGVGVSFFVPNLRYDKALLGGASGGAAGAIGFLAISQILSGLPGGDVLGRLMGAAILGFFIGLMVALVERAFRRIWLEVGYGGRETRTVTLGAEPVSVGSKASACTIYVGSAPDIAFRYWLEQGKVICEDVVTRQKREMVVGEKQIVGRAEVHLKSSNVKTGAATTQAGNATKRIQMPAPPPPGKASGQELPATNPPTQPTRAPLPPKPGVPPAPPPRDTGNATSSLGYPPKPSSIPPAPNRPLLDRPVPPPPRKPPPPPPPPKPR
jgi:hypothetical protein